MRTLDEKSGPLRDIVIDESGCTAAQFEVLKSPASPWMRHTASRCDMRGSSRTHGLSRQLRAYTRVHAFMTAPACALV
eukprot:6213141-Pleurochrysis_carterae.AAC.4